MTLRGAFVPNYDIALFLDVDGTLIEIAPTPSSVKVPAALRNTLNLAAARENGALALVSGRSINELDRLFFPSVFAAAGQHGAERRDTTGNIIRPNIDIATLQPARRELLDMQLKHKGLLLEDKGIALAMHYRLAPKCESIVRALMAELALPLAGQFVLRSGKCVIELAPAGYSKRNAIEAFMSEAPFAGRTPVFIGDDLTDEDGFEAVNAMHGHSIRVGSHEPTSARHRFGSVSAVVAWLRERNINR